LDYLEVKAIVTSLGITIGEFDALLGLTDPAEQTNNRILAIKRDAPKP
jgi:hypothetical protein